MKRDDLDLCRMLFRTQIQYAIPARVTCSLSQRLDVYSPHCHSPTEARSERKMLHDHGFRSSRPFLNGPLGVRI